MLSETTTSWKSALRPGYIEALRLLGAFARARRHILAKNGTIVLTFHRVLPPEALRETFSPRGMIVAADTFKALVQYLCDQFQVVSLADAPHATSADKPKIAITFDDGWSDTAEIAIPILREAGVPATVFVCPGRMGMRNPFWPETALQLFRSAQQKGRLPHLRAACSSVEAGTQVPDESEDRFVEWLKTMSPARRGELLQRLGAEFLAGEVSRGFDQTMSWQQMDELARAGVAIGSHTANHEILTSVPETELYPELIQSRRDIAARLGAPCTILSYPNGSWSAAVRDQVARCGYKAAFINSPGIWREGTDLLAIPRVNVWEGKITGTDGFFSATAFEYSIVRCAATADADVQRTAESRHMHSEELRIRNA